MKLAFLQLRVLPSGCHRKSSLLAPECPLKPPPIFPSRPSPHPSSPLPLAPCSQTPVLEMSLNARFHGKAHASAPPLFRPPRHLLDEFCLYEQDWAVCPLVVRVSRREAWTQEPRERQTRGQQQEEVGSGSVAASGPGQWESDHLLPSVPLVL